MNPNHTEQPNISLPSPSLEGMPSGDTNEPSPALMSPEMQGLQQLPPSLLPAPNDPMSTDMTALPTPHMQTPPLSTTTPIVAEDNDLIEKAWVEKAKSIVAKTKNDPYAQSNEVNHFKADYMKKRYNKDIKIPEE